MLKEILDNRLFHNFCGYCGVSKVENNSINLCYITDYELI